MCLFCVPWLHPCPRKALKGPCIVGESFWERCTMSSLQNTRIGDICSSSYTLYIAFSQWIFFTECRWYSKSAVQERIIAMSCFILMLSRIKNVSSLHFSFRPFLLSSTEGTTTSLFSRDVYTVLAWIIPWGSSSPYLDLSYFSPWVQASNALKSTQTVLLHGQQVFPSLRAS